VRLPPDARVVSDIFRVVRGQRLRRLLFARLPGRFDEEATRSHRMSRLWKRELPPEAA